MKPPEKWEIFGNIYEKNHGDMIGFNHGDLNLIIGFAMFKKWLVDLSC